MISIPSWGARGSHHSTRLGLAWRVSSLAALSLASVIIAAPVEARVVPATDAPVSVRMVDLTADGLLDMVFLRPEGLSIAVNRAGGVFDEQLAQLPAVDLVDVLASDLDGDGLVDLYLVNRGPNLAFLGDGAGQFVEAPEWLGLADAGQGLSAERVDLDLIGADELLLHNADGDVVFWATGRGFQRAEQTPGGTIVATDDDLAALQDLVSRSAGLLALDPEEQLVLGLDAQGRPIVSLGPLQAGGRNQGLSGVSPVARGRAGAVGTLLPPPTHEAYENVPPELTTEEKEILGHMSIVYLPDGQGGPTRKTVRVSGVNWQIVSGSGATNGNDDFPDSVSMTTVNGVGNLIVGCNEMGHPLGDNRTGSHNIVLGRNNNYSSFGGLVGSSLNDIRAPFAMVSGGKGNMAKSLYSSVTGGRSNTAKGAYAAVTGGSFNMATGSNATISGGQGNTAKAARSSIMGGRNNVTKATWSSISGGSFNTANGLHSVIGGGQGNRTFGARSTVSGGFNNIASGAQASVSGGRGNTASGDQTSVSGGAYNSASSDDSSVAGGYGNSANEDGSFAAGGAFNTASGYRSTVMGGLSNGASANGATVSGGVGNDATYKGASVSGGFQNTASSLYSSVSGGVSNTASAWFASVSGGNSNAASEVMASVSGGTNNVASGAASSVSGGSARTASGSNNWVGGSLWENQ